MAVIVVYSQDEPLSSIVSKRTFVAWWAVPVIMLTGCKGASFCAPSSHRSILRPSSCSQCDKDLCNARDNVTKGGSLPSPSCMAGPWRSSCRAPQHHYAKPSSGIRIQDSSFYFVRLVLFSADQILDCQIHGHLPALFTDCPIKSPRINKCLKPRLLGKEPMDLLAAHVTPHNGSAVSLKACAGKSVSILIPLECQQGFDLAEKVEGRGGHAHGAE